MASIVEFSVKVKGDNLSECLANKRVKQAKPQLPAKEVERQKAMEAKAPAKEVVPAPVAEDIIDDIVKEVYSEMTLEELQVECKAKGIKFSPQAKEANLIKKLEA